MSELLVSIIKPSGNIFSGKASMVVMPGSDGELGVMYGHLPMIVQLKEGNIYIYQGKDITSTIPIKSGIAQINSDNLNIII